ncbi:phospholipid/cholesterol/gamma-HCH transport system substrate-binding protein [Ekhidna lutea]|uniref:Phospholipid/cholesterol/gamma-HCH transport system substrate-binding protein n=1 Tax=Ekhidna lutea TaxID=447679 RepID=A0A239K9D4_EKHLU|nr:MlaD family protein [Ekhidna lutea]SNT15066.1 phospholipid/cholesterol/gamma-HCH transport system substrate-binding protein [Ekhidna lutea]
MSKEFKIGLITIIAGALLYYGFNFLRGSDLFAPSNRYYATYTNVSGLNVSNPVYFNGLPVGRVSGFKLVQDKGFIVVSIDIDEGLVIGKDASATLANDGLFGGKAVVLDVGKSQEKAEPGDTLASEMDGGMLSQFEPVADNLNTTITKLNDLLDQLNSTDIAGAVDTLKYSIGAITYKVNQLDVENTLTNVDDLLVSFKQRSEQMDGLLASSKLLVDSLNQVPLSETLSKVNESLDHVNKLLLAVQSDEGTLGKMLNNDSVYNNLNKLLVDLDELVIHFNNYPKDFMGPLGRKNKKLKGISQEGK